MLLGSCGEEPNEDAPRPRSAARRHVCVHDPEHGSIHDRRDQQDPQAKFTQPSRAAAVLTLMGRVCAVLVLALVLPVAATAAGQPQVPPDRPAINALLDRFVPDVVVGKNLKAGWPLAAGYARAVSHRDWLRGETPIQRYPARGTTFHGWKVNYSYPREVGFDILLQPTSTKVGPWSIRAEAQKLGGKWRITTWYVVAQFAPRGKKAAVIGPERLRPVQQPGVERGEGARAGVGADPAARRARHPRHPRRHVRRHPVDAPPLAHPRDRTRPVRVLACDATAPGRLDHGRRLVSVAVAPGLGPLALQVLVDLEEVLDLVPELRRDVLDVGDRGSIAGPATGRRSPSRHRPSRRPCGRRRPVGRGSGNRETWARRRAPSRRVDRRPRRASPR